jgi:amino acid transporter
MTSAGDSAEHTGPADQTGNRPNSPAHAEASSPPIGDAVVDESGVVTEIREPSADEETLPKRVKTLLVGKPRNLQDQSVFHSVSLVAFLAWVGLGADGLSSSCYGPPEAFKTLGEHSYLAVFLSVATILTVLIISACYSHIIEAFPSGGGGYLVASKLLGRPAGVLSGCALLVDYVLTITVSIAAAGDALFGLLGPYLKELVERLRTHGGFHWLPLPGDELKLYCEVAVIIVLIVLNLRGVRESVTALLPVFILFLITHLLLIVGAVLMHLGAAGEVASQVTEQVSAGINDPKFGLFGMLMLLLYAYSFGAGTYTGIEAVSNSMPVMREPRVATAKRTMLYMALSLSLMAGGLMVAYLLMRIGPGTGASAGKTLNQILTERVIDDLGFAPGSWSSILLWATMISEGALLFVAAQAGFIDGPRVLANMAHDSYMPHWFANLSDRLATHNGILLMGLAALAALTYTHGKTEQLMIMYSINVFLTFSLSMVGMCRHWWQERGANPLWRRRLALFVCGAMLCLAILSVTVYEKFKEGGYVTLAVTGILVALCFVTRRYYRGVVARLKRLDASLGQLATSGEPNRAEPDPNEPTAAILVGGYGGLGVHTLLNAVRFGHGHYKNIIFLSVGVVDSGNFKGAEAVEDLKRHTEATLAQYVDLAQRLAMPSTSYMAIGTDAVEELEHLCLAIAKQFPKAVFFAGQLVFQRDTWYQRLFHNQTAYSLQRRLQWDGIPMVILPTRVR